MRTLQYLLFSLLAVFIISGQAFSQTTKADKSIMAGVTTIRLSEVTSVYELHEKLQETLDFPYYYGKNWDAFYECMSEKLTNPAQVTLILRGIKDFEKRFPEDAEKMLSTLKDLKKDFPKNFFVVVN